MNQTAYIDFGKYRLLEMIAHGGMAEIHLATQSGPGGFEKLVVVKRVLTHLSKNESFVRMFLDEARIAAYLSHPNVVQIFDFGLIDDCYFLAMEYLAGEDLGAIIRQARKKQESIPPHIAGLIIAGACDGLHYAHTLADVQGTPLNLVHRDVSPQNILVTFQGVVKVLDFGIARAEGKLFQTQVGTVKGKLRYMSPEQSTGKDLDSRSDVYALGVTLHEMLTGQKLFQGDNELAILQARMGDELKPPSYLRPGLPEQLDAITMRALARNRDDRFPSAREMRLAIDEFLTGCTYAPSADNLRDYLLSLFGKERMAEKVAPRSLARRSKHQSSPWLEGEVEVDIEFTGASEAKPEDVQKPSVDPEPPRDEAVPQSLPTKDSEEASTRSTAMRPFSGRLLAGGAVLGLAATVFVTLLAAGVLTDPPPADTLADPEATGAGAEPVPIEPAGSEKPIEGSSETTPSAGSDTIEAEATGSTDTPNLSADPPRPAARPRPTRPRPNPLAEAVRETVPAPADQPELHGSLDVNCSPWCRIFVDGVDSGHNSPAIGIRLPAGSRHIRVVNPPTGAEEERTVVIRPDETSRVTVRLQ